MGALDDFLAFCGLARLSRLTAAEAVGVSLTDHLIAADNRYSDLVHKLEAKAYSPKTSKKPLTGAQLRNINDAENARFLEDRGEPSNSEVLKEQSNG